MQVGPQRASLGRVAIGSLLVRDRNELHTMSPLAVAHQIRGDAEQVVTTMGVARKGAVDAEKSVIRFLQEVVGEMGELGITPLALLPQAGSR